MSIEPRRTPRRAFLALLALASFAPGCGEDELPSGYSRRAAPLKEIPEKVLAAAKKALPGVEFQDAWSNLDREKKLHSYEIRGRAANGKIREVRVSPEGEILEME